VDMEITSIPPPKLAGESRPITQGTPGASEQLPEEVPVTIDAESRDN